MSRHRHLRHYGVYDDDYENEEEEDYGGEEEDPSLESYIYRREHHDGAGAIALNAVVQEAELQRRQQQQQQADDVLYTRVASVVGETFSRDAIVAALVQANGDPESAVGLLLSSRDLETRRKTRSSPRHTPPPRGLPPSPKTIPSKGALATSNEPTPSSLIRREFRVPALRGAAPIEETRGPLKQNTISMKVDVNRQLNKERTLNDVELMGFTPSTLVLQRLRDEDAILQGVVSPLPSPRTPAGSVPLSPSLPRDAEARRDQAIRDNQDAKERLNLVVIGHVDAGKSTLMGHVLYLLGGVGDRAMHKLEKESKQHGKGSFAFAYVLDSNPEERARGVTMDVALNHFETETKRITLLDAPGHRDFVPHMISGAAQADVAILVVDASIGEFEAGFLADGQTREHTLLARSLGVTQIVVAVNKLDTVNFAQERFDFIKGQLTGFLKKIGFSVNRGKVVFIPCSGFTGENLLQRSHEHLCSWYSGPTLVEQIDKFEPPPRLTMYPLRLCVSDVYKTKMGLTVAGKIEAGTLSIGDKVLAVPNNELVLVKGLERCHSAAASAIAGDNVDVSVSGVDPTNLGIGSVLCAPTNPVPCTDRFQAQILTMGITVPILPGFTVVLYAHNLHEPAHITKLLSLLDKRTGEVIKKKPRCLSRNDMTALVEIRTIRPVPVEPYRQCRALGRFMLREGGRTIAAGIITDIPHASEERG